MKKKLFTSESVTEGHPDKVCDQISDAVLDEILAKDPYARVACECSVTTGLVLVFGEITTSTYVDIPDIVRKTIKEIGYDNNSKGFNGDTCAVMTSIDEQSPEIGSSVEKPLEARMGEKESLGAGDQGMMFGFACDETKELMPLPVSLSHKLAKKLSEVRKNCTLDYLRPDGKTQVTIEYEGDKPKRVDTIIVSTQHCADVELKKIKEDITREVINPVVPKELIDEHTRILVNPSGSFVMGGPQGDSGLTGRKIIVDTYGGYARHGGGSFSGKDPTKVDRSAAYAARYVAKNIVAAGLANKCEIEIAYAIGVANPVSVMVETFGTNKIPEEQIELLILKHFDLRPSAIIKKLKLRHPQYKAVAAYGHMGREDLDVAWEKTDMADILRAEAKM